MRKRHIFLLTTSAFVAIFLLCIFSGLSQSPDPVNSPEGNEYEEVFSAGETNSGVVYINWLLPQATNAFSGAEWFLGAYRIVSEYESNGVSASESLCVDLGRPALTNNLRYAIHCAGGNSVLYLNLLGTNGAVVAGEDMFGNLLVSSNVARYVIGAEERQGADTVLLLNVPTAQYPGAAVIQLRVCHSRGSGNPGAQSSGMTETNYNDEAVVVYEGLLYIDEDGDFFTAEEERRNGTSDYSFDGAGGSISNYYEWMQGTNSGNSATNGSSGSNGGEAGNGGEGQEGQNGKIIYVDQAKGNDALTGRSPEILADKKGPKKTVRGGLSVAESADTIIIKSGDYNENLDIRGRDVRVVIEGNVKL